MKPHLSGRMLKGMIAGATILGTLSVHAQKINGTPGSPTSTYTIQGKSIPIAPLPFEGVIKTEASNSTPYWPAQLAPPKGVPNILLIMTDDQGYGDIAAHGNPYISTPNLSLIHISEPTRPY